MYNISSLILIKPVPRHIVECVAIKVKQFHTLLVNEVCWHRENTSKGTALLQGIYIGAYAKNTNFTTLINGMNTNLME